MVRTDVAVVVIGRNEGEKLDGCLRSVRNFRTVYVDSGSSDRSADRARAAGVEVIELDPAGGFTAARGRNAGLERLIGDRTIAYVQMLDGDCTLDPDWIEAAAAALDHDPALAGVFGRLRERDPDASVYAWLCDREWAVPPGPAGTFGGNVLLRAEAVRDAGLYRPDLIAGEDPDYAIRLRNRGWRLLCLPVAMGTHDAGIERFGQWWRRSVRAGGAFAWLAGTHPPSPLHDFTRNRLRILVWGGAVPLAVLAGFALASLAGPGWLVLSIAALLLMLAQIVRMTRRERRDHGLRRSLAFALFMMIGKYAELIGLLSFHLKRLRGGAKGR